jgi:hypothetical protein
MKNRSPWLPPLLVTWLRPFLVIGGVTSLVTLWFFVSISYPAFVFLVAWYWFPALGHYVDHETAMLIGAILFFVNIITIDILDKRLKLFDAIQHMLTDEEEVKLKGKE